MFETGSVVNKLMAFIFGLRPRCDETAKQFSIRRNRAVAQKVFEADLRCSRHWALKVTTWVEHCRWHGESPAGQLLRCQDPEWLQLRRALSGSLRTSGSIDAGITGTRAGPGKPIRYLGTWYQTLSFDNPCKDISQSRETSMLLWTAARHGKLFGISMEEAA